MIRLNFFVEKNTKDSDEIKEMVKALNQKKFMYKVHELNQNNINGKNLPILKMTLETGEVLEYDQNTMFNVIVGLVRIGM